MPKYRIDQRVILEKDGTTYHGYVYEVVNREYNDTSGQYYYVQWDKAGKYLYHEDMLQPEPKENKAK